MLGVCIKKRQPSGNDVVTDIMAEAGMAILHNSSPMTGTTPPVRDAATTPPHDMLKMANELWVRTNAYHPLLAQRQHRLAKPTKL